MIAYGLCMTTYSYYYLAEPITGKWFGSNYLIFCCNIRPSELRSGLKIEGDWKWMVEGGRHDSGDIGPEYFKKFTCITKSQYQCLWNLKN